MKYIPYGHQDLDQNDVDAVVEVLRSSWLTQGPAISDFESALLKYTGASYAVALSNATAALHLSCMALGLGEGDYLWTTPNTFVASANCGLYCKAQVDFVDIELSTYNLDVNQLEKKLIVAKRERKLPKIVVPVHFAGQSCDMQAIRYLADKYGFYIIEDASHGIGGSYQQKKLGSCAYADITVFSFHPVKIITTGEGGVALTNQVELYEKLQRLRTHGITRNPKWMTRKTEGAWYYEQVELGFNYRMTDIQAALGQSQLHRMDAFIERRHEIASFYAQKIHFPDVQLPSFPSTAVSALHLYPILVPAKERREIFDFLTARRIGVNVHYIPVYRQPYYEALGFKQGYCPNAEQYYARTISLPMFPALASSELEYVVSTLKEAYEACSRDRTVRA